MAGTSGLTTGSQPTRPCWSLITPTRVWTRPANTTPPRELPPFLLTVRPRALTTTWLVLLSSLLTSLLPPVTTCSCTTLAVSSPQLWAAPLISTTLSLQSVGVLRTASSTTSSGTPGVLAGVRVVSSAFKHPTVPVFAVSTSMSSTPLFEQLVCYLITRCENNQFSLISSQTCTLYNTSSLSFYQPQFIILKLGLRL